MKENNVTEIPEQSEKIRSAIETLLFNGYQVYHNGSRAVPTSRNCRTWSWVKP